MVPFDGNFRLTGEPRFQDKKYWSPFHWYCRTSVVRVPLAQADDDVTAKIMAMRDKELKLRANAEAEILEIYDKLIERGTMPDAVKRAVDTKEIGVLRRRLLNLRQRGKYPES